MPNPSTVMNINKIIYTLLITDIPRIQSGKGRAEYTAQDRRMIRKKAQLKVKQAKKRRKKK